MRPLTRVLLAACCLLSTDVARAQGGPERIVDVRIEQEGQPVTEPLIADLVETRAGQPLSMRGVREAVGHLMSLNRFEDVQVFSVVVAGGVQLRYVLFPSHRVDRVEFRGTLGLSVRELRGAVAERFGTAPPAARATEVAEALLARYRDRGFQHATVVPRLEETHNPDRASLVLDVAAGLRAAISRVDIAQADGVEPSTGITPPAIRAGQLYDAEAITQELQRYEGNLRERGYYEARVTHSVEFGDGGGALVTIAVDRGPMVSVAFTGDPLSAGDRDRLVPVRAEGSADEDLLEDATRAIQNDLSARGYRDERAVYTREAREGTLTVTFNVTRGRRYVVSSVEIEGHTAIATDELRPLLSLKADEPFVQAALDRGVASMRNLYRLRGFTRVVVLPTVVGLPPTAGAEPADVRPTNVRIAITEGPRTLIGAISFEGGTGLAEPALRALLRAAAGRPFSEAEIAADRDRIDLEYRNRGFDSVVVSPKVTLAENDTRADVVFAIAPGAQAIVDHVIIAGNVRTRTETIERELLLHPGEPLGYSARLESQQRLAALGLFRRVRIEELPHPGESRRDLLVQVEESPPTTLGYGGGVEAGTRLRSDANGLAVERFEAVPRGFFEVGRRNMFGKNRSVNLFTRVSLRARDALTPSAAGQPPQPTGQNDYGFNEYRAVGTYREPRILGTGADLLVTGVLEQAVRSSFNFVRRQVRSELGVRLSPKYSAAGFYSIERTELFDEKFTASADPLLIDRLFPQVRLAKVSGSLLRDTRNDVADAQRGSLLVATSDMAVRSLGSQVGFIKTYLQAFTYRRLPGERRSVVALGARLGAAHGFARMVDGGTVQDLPASERFFAGGDTTVRGFSLDRLGAADTITTSGFPTGGNGLIILNAEWRVAVVRAFDAVTFVDAGNVFQYVGDLNLGALRPAVGFGVHYRSPVGPIRVELGFNVHPRELVPGHREKGSVLNISLGRAF